jgi:UPF0755 protein
MRPIKTIIKILLPTLFCFAIAAVMAYSLINQYYTSSSLPEQPTTVIIKSGASVAAIANQLTDAKVIKYPLLFTQIAKYSEQTNLKMGEYNFLPQSSPREILRKMEAGEVVVRKFTIPEGKSSYDIIQILAAADGLTGNLPAAIEEGSVLPNTYHYELGDSYADIVKKMRADMNAKVAELWEKRDKSIPLQTPQEALILASIVEKETGLDGERGLVASVFINRLNKGMRLESDPTAVYGITFGKPLGESVARKHVQHENAYNTYKIDRLPPTPICAVGIDALKAVLNPPDSDFFYFVADGKGGHNFAKTLSEHNDNVVKYRAALKQTATKN